MGKNYPKVRIRKKEKNKKCRRKKKKRIPPPKRRCTGKENFPYLVGRGRTTLDCLKGGKIGKTP